MSAVELVKVGNRTECALLQLALGLGANYEDIREQADQLRVLPFSSDRKRMSVIVAEPGSM